MGKNQITFDMAQSVLREHYFLMCVLFILRPCDVQTLLALNQNTNMLKIVVAERIQVTFRLKIRIHHTDPLGS